MNAKGFFIISLAFFLFLMPPVKADGAAFIIGRDFSAEALHGEHTQIAAINYEDGKEKLVIAVKMDQIGENEVAWIVPVPSDPEEVEINVLEDFPRFMGTDMEERVRSAKEGFLNAVSGGVALTQIWPLPGLIIYGWTMTGFGGLAGRGVEVYAEVEKEGILTQVVTAETSQGLYDYLTEKGVSVSDLSIPVLDDYIGGDYCFVVSWLTGTGSPEGYRVPAIFVEFPTEKIFYPLKPTSLYGERGVPVILYVIGFVKPDFYEEIEEYARYKYFETGVYVTDDWPSEFYSGGFPEGYYTRINIGSENSVYFYFYGDEAMSVETPPAKNFVGDLWMEKPGSPPPEVERAVFISNAFSILSSPLGSIAWLALVSIISALIAGVLVFRDSGISKLGVIGLANCLTIIGLILAMKKLEKEKSRDEKIGFLVLFSVFFWVINLFVIFPVMALIV